jgi:predicted O-methyltransferase YrrM
MHMQQIKKAIKESDVLRRFQDVSAPLMRDLPVERWPGWLGMLHGVKVPRGVKRHYPGGAATPANINILLTLLRRTADVEGSVAECGVYQGSTLLPMGLYLDQTHSPKQILAFDSFQGFDASVEIDLAMGGADDAHKRSGGFGDTSYARLCTRVTRLGLNGRISILPGYFHDTLERCSGRLDAQRFSLVHLDCDIYASYKECLEFFYPRLSQGGIILLDEYNDPPWPGCNKAVDEFLSDKPERLHEIASDGYLKYYFVKGWSG